MNTINKNRLPGIYFQAKSPPLEEILPRMDIAAFVGLAASGPLDTPVPVEDMRWFREIFGDDLPLAWNATTGQMQYAHLASVVEAFFRNGGRRCWVVRVAENTRARINRFSLPGLIRTDNWRPALARARCEGSWSDKLRIGAVRLSQNFTVADFDPNDYSVDLMAMPGQVQPGDLLQLHFGEDGLLLFLTADSVETAFPIRRFSRTRHTQHITGQWGHWFLRHNTSISALEARHAILLTSEGDQSLPFLRVQLPGEESPFYVVELDLPLEEAPAPGELLCIDFDGNQSLLLPVMEAKEVISETSLPARTVQVIGKEGLWPVEESYGQELAIAWQAADSPPQKRQPSAERLTFELRAWKDQEVHARISELAFGKKHARFWACLPLDKDLFSLPDGRTAHAKPTTLETEVFEPRFPLAGPEKPAALYLPLGMSLLSGSITSQGPLGATEPDTTLERDGLENFSADLFLDPDLAPIGSGALLTEANHKYYLRDEPLRGLHSLLPLEEVTLVAVPDAVQRGWEKTGTLSPDLLPAPLLMPVSQPDNQGAYRLSWSAVESAASYILQEGADPTFAQPVTRYKGPETTVPVPGRKDCPRSHYYRVRAERRSKLSPWSNTEKIIVPRPDFEDCQTTALAASELASISMTSAPENGYDLFWSPVDDAAGYTLQEAADPAFNTATTIYMGGETTFRIRRRSDGVYYYRVRATHNGELGPWSNTQSFTSLPRQAWTVKKLEAYRNGDLLAIQRALLRFCTARGDLLALLTLPIHYREEEALAYVTALTPQSGRDLEEARDSGQARVMPLTLDEERVLSFGALYHPWIAARVEGGRGAVFIRFTPPDGAVCGAIAAAAIARGAWVAPANDPFRGVVALDPAIGSQGWGCLFEAQVNVIRQDPRGFLLLSADTLSPESALQPINVRRLLILLRRVALREGVPLVFEPNNESFRSLVQRTFERVLSDLYVRGAFAGETSEKAYQVITNGSVNTQSSLEQGRFITELRVAPSRPMAFITVRLVQTGNTGLVVTEI